MKTFLSIKRSLIVFMCLLPVALFAQPYSWQDDYANILPNGDMQWQPKAFAYTPGASVRYIDFEAGDDAATGTTTASAWKHHPWDAAATGNSLACSGIHTYVFKRGVIYRGTLTAKESGTTGNPIRLTSDPAWGTGEAAIYGSTRLTSGWTQCNATSAPKIPTPDKVWYKDLSASLPATKVVCEVNGSIISRVKLARIPNWNITDTADPLSQCWVWTGPATEGNTIGYRVDIKNLTQTDATYFNGATVWSQNTGMMGTLWGDPLISFDPATHMIKTQFNFGQAKDRYFIENNPHLLDTANEYFFDKSGSFPGRLYIRLAGDKNPNTTIVEVATLESSMININGLHDIAISGLTFGFITSTAMRWGADNQMAACAVYISGTTSNINISNCHFMYLNNVISAGGNCSYIYITDNNMERVDDQAITFSPGNQKNIYICRNHLFDVSGRTNCRWYSPLCAITGTFQQAEIAGNFLEMCWGSGIYMFWATGPYVRGMVHHNKVNWSLLATCDWGALESWNGGPVYYFNNISKNPRGYMNGLGRSWGMAFYTDGFACMQRFFNNIAIGTGCNPGDEKHSSGPGFEQTSGTSNIYANNTSYNFYYPTYSQNPQGNNFFLGFLFSNVSKNYFSHETSSADLPFQSISNNVFYGGIYKPWMGHFTPATDFYSLEDFQKGASDNKLKCSQIGWKALNPVLTDPAAGNMLPVSGGEAIDRGVKVFIPYSLSNETGIWNFYRHTADSSLISGENYYSGTQRVNLTAHGLSSGSFIKGNLEDWTEGALDFNGTSTYCSSSSSNTNMTTNNFIIETYFRTIKNSVSKILVSKYSGTGNGYILDVNASGQPRMRVLTGGSDAVTLSGAVAVNDGNWHHVLAEVDRAGVLSMYVDGAASAGTATGAMPAAGTSLTNTASFYVGRDNTGNYFDGTFDFLRISKGTLADAATTYDELYTWEFDGPFLKDFMGNKPQGTRDAGACDNGKLDGEGLRGDYYDNQNFTSLIKTVIDPTVNFNWGAAAPDASMGADQYSVRWTGQILPKYSENYTFEVEHADGVRLWVNGRLLIDSWTDGSATQTETIKLLANQKYDIKLEYYENTSTSKIILRWQSASQAKEVIPAVSLYPPCLLALSSSSLLFGYDTSANTITMQYAKTANVATDQKWLFASVSNGVVTVTVSKNPFKNERNGKVTVAGCQAKIITVKQSGNPTIEIKPNLMNSISFFPNPAKDRLTIETPDIDLSQEIFINVFDLQGRLMQSQLITSDKTTLDVSTLPEGIYIIRIGANEGSFAGKFIKM